MNNRREGITPSVASNRAKRDARVARSKLVVDF